MEYAEEAVVLCSEEKKREMLRMRKKIVKEAASKTKTQRPQKDRNGRPFKDRSLGTLQVIKEADVMLPNPYNSESKDVVKNRREGYSAPTRRWELVEGLRRRNRVEDATDMSGKRTNKDLGFMQLIQGRPIKERLVRRQYIDEVKKSLLNNVLSGFLEDEIKAREESSVATNDAILSTHQEVEAASKSMADFLSQEQKKYENLTKELNKVVDGRKNTEALIENEKKKMSEVKVMIFKQNEELETMRKCRAFLLEIAPEEWNKDYAQETKKRQEEVEKESARMRGAMQNFKSNCGSDDEGLEQILEDLIKEFSEAGPPMLPFTDPKTVFALFKNLELKCLLALHNNANLKTMVDRAKSIYESYDQIIKTEQGAIDASLKGVQKDVETEKLKLNHKKEIFLNIIQGPFKELVASEEILKEHALVKNVYEEVIDSPKEGLNTLEMLQEIGELYMDLDRKLEHLSESDKNYLKNVVRLELEKKMKEAEKAERRKKQVQGMVKGLQRAREKPWKPVGRSLLFRSSLEDRKSRQEEVQQGQQLKVSQPTINEEVIEEPEESLPLVWACNHPGPGPYQRDSEKVATPDYRNFYPDLELIDTEESEGILSDSEEEKEKKETESQEQDEKKVKRKKKVKIVLSESDGST